MAVALPTLPEWLQGLNWGSVPEWLAGIGTVGALFLALILFMKDRKAEFYRHADSFAVWLITERHRNEDESYKFRYVIHGMNASDSPLPVAYVKYKNPDSGKYEAMMFGSGHDRGVKARQEVVRQTPLIESDEKPEFVVHFRDSTGKHWARNLEGWKYLSERKIKQSNKVQAVWIERH